VRRREGLPREYLAWGALDGALNFPLASVKQHTIQYLPLIHSAVAVPTNRDSAGARQI
jgi:hypothetical protein